MRVIARCAFRSTLGATVKVKSVYCHLDHFKGIPQAHATIDVPGLGEVKIEHALTEATIQIIMAESIAALKISLGQVLVASEPEPQS